MSQARQSAAELRLAADHAARAGDNGLRARALGWQVAALTWGPNDVEQVAQELKALEREQDAGPLLVASVTLLRGELVPGQAMFARSGRERQVVVRRARQRDPLDSSRCSVNFGGRPPP